MKIKKMIKFWKQYENTIIGTGAKENIVKLERKHKRRIKKSRKEK